MRIEYYYVKENNMKIVKRSPKIEYNESDLLDDKILKIRGIDNKLKYDFITPTEKYLNDPFLLKNMEIAVEKTQNAIINDVKISVYGDP